MKDALFLLVSIIPVTASILTTSYLIYHGVQGWGWMVAVTLILSTLRVRIGDDEKKEKKQ